MKATKQLHQPIIDQCKNNSSKAQMQLYNLYCQAMINVAFRYVKDRFVAEDVMQDAFIKAFKNIKNYKNEVAFGAWLKRIVINQSIDQLKKNKLELVSINEEVYKVENDENWKVDATISVDKIVRVINSLKEKYRLVLTLYLLEGYDHQEISEILKITENTSRTHLLRGKKLLKEQLKTQVMQKDIRDVLRDYKSENVGLSNNHSSKFEDLLQQEMHQPKPKKNNYKWLSIAASVVLLISLAIKFYPTNTIEEDPKTTSKEITLGNISPEFQTIETYYTNSINLEISQLELTEENKEMVDGYLFKIAELTKEYKSLTKELNTKGVNDSTIDALIRNLQLRLQLLQRLKKQLKQLKNLNTNQNETQII